MTFLNKIAKGNKEKGVSLYISFLLLTTLLSLALGLSALLVGQLKIIRGVGDSLIAIYAAEVGVERVLYIDTEFCGLEDSFAERVDCIQEQLDTLSPPEFQLSNGASYNLLVEGTGEGNCPSSVSTYCTKSTGSFKEARRAIRVTR